MTQNTSNDVSQESTIKLIEASFCDAWKVFSILPHSIWRETSNVTMFSTGINDSLLNGVLNFNGSSGDLKPQIKDVLKFFGHLPFSWYVTPSCSHANLGDYLIDSGLYLADKTVGMAVNLKRLGNSVISNNNVDINLVKTKAELSNWIDTFSKGFGVSEEFLMAVSSVYGKTSYESHFLGMIDNKPVATITLSLKNNIASIYDVSTVPEFRNQGIGTTMTLNALKKAQAENFEMSVLQSSEMGVGVYQKLGFVKYYEFERYTSTLDNQ